MRKQLILGILTALACLTSSAATLPRALQEYLSGDFVVVPKFYPKESELKATDWGKYEKTLAMLTQNNYGCVIRQAAQIYHVDPVAIMGAVLGEHTYNVNGWDVWGERYLSMRQKWIKRFEATEGETKISLIDLLSETEYSKCQQSSTTSYDLWDCYDNKWARDPRNVKKRNALKWTFFNPLGTGFTYGLGQLGPDRALMLTDIVHQMSRLPLLDPADPMTLYDHILNPQISLHYVAASILVSINIYKDLANIDISENPGILATLYNLGKEKRRALEKYNENVRSLEKTGQFILPATNPYGTLINFKQDEIRSTYQKRIESLPDSTCRQYLL